MWRAPPNHVFMHISSSFVFILAPVSQSDFRAPCSYQSEQCTPGFISQVYVHSLKPSNCHMYCRSPKSRVKIKQYSHPFCCDFSTALLPLRCSSHRQKGEKRRFGFVCFFLKVIFITKDVDGYDADPIEV